MRRLPFPLSILTWLGRQGTRAIALSCGVGILLPGASSFVRPWLGVTIFLILTMAFLQVDMRALWQKLNRPLHLLKTMIWLMLALPLIASGALWATGLANNYPDTLMIVFIVCAAPPLMSAPAFAVLLGLDGALSLAILIGCLIITPFTAPALAYLFLPDGFSLAPIDLAIRLFGLLAGSFALATAIRALVGNERLRTNHLELSGLNVILLTLFALIAMDSVRDHLARTPLMVVGLTALTFVVAFAMMAASLFLAPKNRPEERMVIAMAAGTRNMGIMVAALGQAIPEFVWLYFALSQFPIYLLPIMLQPIARRVTAASD